MRTLHLEKFVLQDISSIAALVMLEILSLFGYKIQELPREIRHLQHLKLLDITECEQLNQIPPGVLSSFNQTRRATCTAASEDEALCKANKEKSFPSLDELISLPDHLKVLYIHIPVLVQFFEQSFRHSQVSFDNLTKLLKVEGSIHTTL